MSLPNQTKRNTATARKARRIIRRMVRGLRRIGDTESHLAASRWQKVARGLYG